MQRPWKAIAQLALGAFVTIGAHSVRAKEPWQNDWIEVRSPHFIITSAMPEKSTVMLAVDLEHFRRAASILTNIGEFEERVPTRIYLLKQREEELGLDRTIAGLFVPGMRSNHAVLSSTGSMTNVVLKHEYVHFLVNNRSQQVYPPWFNEGFAELLSSLRMRDARTIEYGDIPKMRADWLNYNGWISFDRIIAARDVFSMNDNAAAMFYAQSWYLMHYLMLGRQDVDFAAQANEFLRLSESNVAPGEAFQRSFGIAPDQLRGVLESYRRQLRLTRVRLKNPRPEVQTSARPLPLDEIAAELGQIVLAQQGEAVARKYFNAALAANPSNANALIGMGDAEKFAGRFDEAMPYFERALEVEPGNAWHELDFAEYFLDRARKDIEAGAGKDRLVESRRHFARSYKLDPENPETLAMNGVSYLLPGEDSAKALVSLEAAAQLLPSNTEIRNYLAQAYIAAGNREAARAELMRLAAWSHPKDAARIRKMLDELESANASTAPASESSAEIE